MQQIKKSISKIFSTTCSIGLLFLIATNLQGQNDNLEQFSIWKPGLGIKSKTITVNEFQRKKVVVKNNPWLSVLADGAEQILRLTKCDTIILISIPQIDNVQLPHMIQHLTSIRMLLDNSSIGATYIDEFVIGPTTFGEKFFELARDQTSTRGHYAEHIQIQVLSNDPEAIQIELTGGPYGDMTLIYTADSPIPEITIHE